MKFWIELVLRSGISIGPSIRLASGLLNHSSFMDFDGFYNIHFVQI